MSPTEIIAALVALLSAAPALVTDVEAVIAAFKGGGASAATAAAANKFASSTAADETWLQTPLATTATASTPDVSGS